MSFTIEGFILKGDNKLKKWLNLSMLLIVMSGTILYLYLGSFIKKGEETTADGQHAYMIVLGAKIRADHTPSSSLKNRLDAAATYLHTYEHVTVIVSGGQGKDEPATEASIMKNYLINKGIAPERIIEEDQSTSTYENLLYSQALLPASVQALTIVSNDFHLARASYLAKQLQLETDVVSAPTPRVTETKSRLRERLALLKTFVTGP